MDCAPSSGPFLGGRPVRQSSWSDMPGLCVALIAHPRPGRISSDEASPLAHCRGSFCSPGSGVFHAAVGKRQGIIICKVTMCPR